MKTIHIQATTHTKTYPIFIGGGLMDNIEKIINPEQFSRVFVITDTHIAPLFLRKIESGFSHASSHIILNSGEKAKNIESVKKIWVAMHASNCDRKTLVIHLGGGVMSDVGGFAASTYMRGLPFITIPTTLLAQVDASVGGKTGIDFDGIKNLVGTFNQPTAVVVDPEVLVTLPKREFISGFAEIIKHGLIADKKHFMHASIKKPKEFSLKELVHIITRSLEIKVQTVEKDPTEQHMRKILNFGHTIGHAIEALSLKTDKPLLHGEAISIGMIAEAKISASVGLLSAPEFEQIRKALLQAELPVSLKSIHVEKILEKIKSDKKSVGNMVNFTLLEGIGKAKINQHIPQEILIQALKGITNA